MKRTFIDVGVYEGRGLCVRACNDDRLGPHDVGLQARRAESVDMFLSTHQDFSCQMAALFGAYRKEAFGIS